MNLFLSGFISSLPQLAWEKGYVVVVVVVNESVPFLMAVIMPKESRSKVFYFL